MVRGFATKLSTVSFDFRSWQLFIKHLKTSYNHMYLYSVLSLPLSLLWVWTGVLWVCVLSVVKSVPISLTHSPTGCWISVRYCMLPSLKAHLSDSEGWFTVASVGLEWTRTVSKDVDATFACLSEGCQPPSWRGAIFLAGWAWLRELNFASTSTA